MTAHAEVTGSLPTRPAPGHAERWPFGDGPGQEPYLIAGRTRMMRTARLLEYLERHPPTGRGPAQESRPDR